MDVRIETQAVELPKHTASRLRKRIAEFMGRIGSRINYIHLSLRDINGKKGGRDKVCTIRAVLIDGGEVVVVDRSSRVAKALFRGLRRTRTVVRRELQRRGKRNRRRAVPEFSEAPAMT